MSFVHLSVRSDMSGTARSSIQDYVGAGKIEEYAKKAAELGQPALAVTDLGTMRNVYTLKKACDKYGIKPIYGVEVYVCLDHTKKNVSKELSEEICKNLPPSKWREAVDQYALDNGHMRGERDLATLTLWAGTDEGLRNLFKLTSKSWVDGFFYKPRVDVSMLREFSEGVFCGTAGPNSWIHKPNFAGRRREAIERFKELSSIFSDRLVLEIRPHQLLEQQICNEFCFELNFMHQARCVATQGVYYVDRGGLAAQKMLCAIGTGKGSELSSCGLEIDNYWLKSEDEMIDAFLDCGLFDVKLEAQEFVESSAVFAEQLNANFKLDPFAMIIPDIDTGDLSHVQFLKVRTSASERWASIPQEKWPTYRDRLVEELEELAKPVSPDSEATFASYIVYVNEVISMCRELGIALGPGRGSAAGSIVNWLLGITDVDPVEHGLMFSRFIAPNRIGPPDVDIDVDPSKRPLLFDKMKERWGEDCVAQISTFGKLKGRVVMNDVCRELKVPIPETSAVTKYIEQKSDFEDGAFETVKAAFVGTEDHPPIGDCVSFATKHPDVLPYAMQLEGKMRNLGVHPAGIVCAPRPLSDFIPLETRKGKDDERVVVTAFDMQGVEQCGLLKIDMLGLITVNVIANALDKINEGREEPLTMSNIPLDDAETLKAFEERDFVGVFQFDSASAKKLCKGVTFPSFGTISDMTALNRPGPLDSGMAEQYIARKADPSLIEVDYCEGVSRITEETLGVMIYQEQVMQVCGEVGLHENPDTMRKIIGKKLMDKIEAERDGFVAGAAKSNPDMDNATANKLYDDIVTFGRYGFNKCVAYDTLLHRADDSSGKITVEEAYNIWNSKPRTPLAGKMRNGAWRVLAMSDDGRVRPHYVKDIHKNGLRSVTRFETESGRVIEVTENHRLLTDRGYVAASEISESDVLVACGEYEQTDNTNGRGRGHAKGGTYDGRGFQTGKDNPSYIDGRTVLLAYAKEVVVERAGGVCEGCGLPALGSERFEFAHQKTLEECGGNYERFHNEKNLKHLCNSCHKSLDYQKGERKPAWTKGRPTFPDPIISIQRNLREVMTYDLEMAGDPHNFIAGTNGGIVSHNSHSVAYAKIGYLCQYLKVHYPLEFFWAMMLSASENGKNDKLRQYAKEAKARGLKVLPPNVSKSGFKLGIDREQNAIIGALNDVKKVGDKAAKSIVANQPFESFEDFISRVNRRSVNMGCIVALAHAGALDDLLDNVKRFVDNAEFLFKESKLKRFRGWEETIASFEGPDYTLDEKLFWRSEVNPMALDNPYASMLDKMNFEVQEYEDKNFMEEFDTESIWVSGTLRGVRIYQDTGFGDRNLSDLEREHESYGKEYAVCSIESDSGKTLKVKIPSHVYETFKAEVEDDEPVVMNVRVDNTYSTLRCNFALSLRKMKMTDKPTVLQSIPFKHPIQQLRSLSSSDKSHASRDMKAMKKLLREGHIDTLPVLGLVTSIRTKLAGKRLSEMAWVGIVTVDGDFSEVTVFSSDWLGESWKGKAKHKIKGTFGVGSLISVDCGGNEFNGRFSLQYNGHGTKVLA